ncbi:hypothetical protein BX600DRAFT_445356 [Xylariales sp. PMI_506]|nr:hypothetical protein BX600DRAFT_445356 [Xylariales sp. PMI_506]
MAELIQQVLKCLIGRQQPLFSFGENQPIAIDTMATASRELYQRHAGTPSRG